MSRHGNDWLSYDFQGRPELLGRYLWEMERNSFVRDWRGVGVGDVPEKYRSEKGGTVQPLWGRFSELGEGEAEKLLLEA